MMLKTLLDDAQACADAAITNLRNTIEVCLRDEMIKLSGATEMVNQIIELHVGMGVWQITCKRDYGIPDVVETPKFLSLYRDICQKFGPDAVPDILIRVKNTEIIHDLRR